MLVFPYLFAKALFKKKLNNVKKGFENRQQGELIDYEEISSQPRKEERLELPRLVDKMEKQQRNDYDNMFD